MAIDSGPNPQTFWMVMYPGKLNIEEISKGRYRLELSLELELPPRQFNSQPDMRTPDITSDPTLKDPDTQDKGRKVALTVKEAAEQLDISRSSIYDLLRSGQLESIKIGRLRRIPATCLRAYVERRLAEER